jgi:hypothetical protein
MADPIPYKLMGTSPEPIKDWSLRSLKEKLIKIGAKVASHGCYGRGRHPPAFTRACIIFWVEPIWGCAAFHRMIVPAMLAQAVRM